MNGQGNDSKETTEVDGAGSHSPTPSENSVSATATSSHVGAADTARFSNSGTAAHSASRDGITKNWYEKESLLKFVRPCSICFKGMNNSGKTTYLTKMLEQTEGVFTDPPKRVIVCYNIFQDLFRRNAETVPNISFSRA